MQRFRWNHVLGDKVDSAAVFGVGFTESCGVRPLAAGCSSWAGTGRWTEPVSPARRKQWPCGQLWRPQGRGSLGR